MQDQPSSQPEQPSYPYPQPGPGMPPPQQYQQPYQQPPMQPGIYPPQQPSKKKRGPLFWIGGGCLALVLLTVIGGIIIVASAAHSVSTTVNNISTTVTADTGNSSGSGNQISKVGGTITLDDVQATLLSVKTNPGDQYNQPKTGNEYVIVNVKLHNTNNGERDYNPFEFHVKSGSGDITDEEFVGFEGNNQLSSGKLSSGGTTQGEMVFQVPNGDHKAELTWQPSFLGNAGDNGWLLGL